ncbi:conjugal transfer protein TraI [Umezawaea tangerina]|uniref:Conjugal transfer protein TraI n=1 Tax=Umezawaea tangerina TaxID=84725 RepID=A0A2T0SS78_9PSEU|nr:conjugal transfer protein TraI [Umezawaea tangerina]PRY36271.1 hypothetical protein CLV43_112198 [Umezawaea tangerina]
MSTTADHTDDPGDHDDEITRGLDALTAHLASVAPRPTAPAPTPAPVATPIMSKRVSKRLAEHTEAAQLLELDDDDTPFLIESESVRKRRKAVRRAGQLYLLDQDPAALAYRDARMRRLVITLGMAALVLGLAWSTAGVQHFAAATSQPYSVGWWLAWLVEPVCSLALLMIVGARAYLAVRGTPLDATAVTRIERVFLALIVFMNIWPYLPWTLPAGQAFTLAPVVVHLLGPIVAVAVTHTLPVILARFADLHHTALRTTAGIHATDGDGVTGPSCSANTPAGPRPELAALVERVRALITAGQLRPDVGVRPIRRALSCSMATATEVRDALNRTTH